MIRLLVLFLRLHLYISVYSGPHCKTAFLMLIGLQCSYKIKEISVLDLDWMWSNNTQIRARRICYIKISKSLYCVYVSASKHMYRTIDNLPSNSLFEVLSSVMPSMCRPRKLVCCLTFYFVGMKLKVDVNLSFCYQTLVPCCDFPEGWNVGVLIFHNYREQKL